MAGTWQQPKEGLFMPKQKKKAKIQDDERRSQPRFKFGALNRIAIKDPKSGTAYQACGFDVSEYGMGVEIDGERLKLSEVDLVVGDLSIPLQLKWVVTADSADQTVNRYGFATKNPDANLLMILLSAGYDIEVEFHEEDFKDISKTSTRRSA